MKSFDTRPDEKPSPWDDAVCPRGSRLKYRWVMDNSQLSLKVTIFIKCDCGCETFRSDEYYRRGFLHESDEDKFFAQCLRKTIDRIIWPTKVIGWTQRNKRAKLRTHKRMARNMRKYL